MRAQYLVRQQVALVSVLVVAAVQRSPGQLWLLKVNRAASTGRLQLPPEMTMQQ